MAKTSMDVFVRRRKRLTTDSWGSFYDAEQWFRTVSIEV